MNAIQTLKKSAREVTSCAQFVCINSSRLTEFSRALRLPESSIVLDSTLMDVGDLRTKIAFVLTRDAINFGSGFHQSVYKLPGMSGARTMGWLLHDHFKQNGIMRPEALASMTADDCAALFRQQKAGAGYELMQMFAVAWNELGQFIVSRYKGEFQNFIEDVQLSAIRFIEILSHLPLWCDISRYKGYQLPFMKRAQLAAYGLSLTGHRSCRFSDLSELSIFCDNLIPHVLCVDGVLQIEPAMAERISEGRHLQQGSAEEIELRSATVAACEKIVADCRSHSYDIDALQLAARIWKQGQGPRYKKVPRPRVVTYFY